ncbi:LuxR family two component transcriptional regulator [Ornithinicoccus hortensis]|uniref:LuxR family two component transcriptional regulator n=1 Tax=Ornithinicoccus hortensis TaxID=82346 RepID=A0A542YU94_9MICO|nr:response regulator transcription factor [Ornithinicoccus hortensis]TQL51660.1 LuxR family two component transcriptional regulator [Ornithinicoccus hortensis]
MTTRILLAEDQGMLRSALASLLDVEPDMEVVAQVGRGDEIVPAAVEHRPDVALVDIDLPGGSGLDALPDLARQAPDCTAIIVTTFARAGYLRRAMSAGARGFLVKDDPVEQLAASIRRVLAGQVVVQPDLAVAALSAPANPLTDREQEVLRASRDGAVVADIAGRLYLSEQTVRNYLSAAIGKTGARNRAEALARAEDHGWV